jgi:enoyl-CoA hydratase
MIRVDRDGPLWTVTLDRPDKANSLTGAMLQDLADVAAEAADAPDLARPDPDRRGGKGVLRRRRSGGGACGPRHRACLGGGVGQFRGAGVPDHRALNGTLAGGAFGMALACDIRLAVPNARFFYPVAKLGFLPQPSDPGHGCGR